jgi:hypothetical protein
LIGTTWSQMWTRNLLSIFAEEEARSKPTPEKMGSLSMVQESSRTYLFGGCFPLLQKEVVRRAAVGQQVRMNSSGARDPGQTARHLL